MTAAVYLLHFDRRYEHAGHYLGSTRDLAARLAAHERGQGARLMAVVREAGIGWQLAQTWPGGRDLERQLKQRHAAPRLCPICRGEPVTAQRPGLRVPAPQRPLAAVAAPTAVLAPYDSGAHSARRWVAAQIAAGHAPDLIEAIQARMRSHYDPATARPKAREEHRGFTETAAGLLASYRAQVAAAATPAALAAAI